MSKSGNKRLPFNRLKEISRTAGKVVFQAIVDDDVTRKDLTSSDFYSLSGGVLARGGQFAEIEILNDSTSYYFKGMILDAGATHAIVKELQYIDFSSKKVGKTKSKKVSDESGGDDDAKAEDDEANKDEDLSNQGYSVRKQGATWSVIAPDGRAVKYGIKTKSEAQSELEDHLLALSM